jgi:hypothetical protein
MNSEPGKEGRKDDALSWPTDTVSSSQVVILAVRNPLGHVTWFFLHKGDFSQFCYVSLLQQTEVLLKSAVFWGITQRRVVIVYRRFGTDTLSQNIGKQLPHDAA